MGGSVHLRVWADTAVLGLWGQVGAMSVSRTGEQGASGRSLRQAVRWQSLGGACRRCAAGRCIVYAGVCACVGVCLGGCH